MLILFCIYSTVLDIFCLAGEYEILDAFITYAGSDLACFNAYTAEVTTPNTATSENLANFAIGFVPNVAVGDFIPADENKVRL